MTPFIGTLRRTVTRPEFIRARPLSTLQGHSHIYTFSHGISPDTHTLSLLPTDPPTLHLAIGTTSKLPPTPDSFVENPEFLCILQSFLAKHAHADPDVQSQAQVMASTAGANLVSGGVFRTHHPRQRKPGGESSSGASGQGGAGSGRRGGFIHVSDGRNPPEYGRIAWPEDIFGSLEVDGHGNIEGNGNYQPSGTYRIVTRNGILGLSPFLREKLVQRLRAEEQNLRGK
ncbi:hypothetical protein LOZ57_003616 [Ophidiomyces ophidiicola]|uniref:uncharacterized protein n=1 Tax=Ophidiomyces ophidiicola TaxID=1387563 RepID=UPI0020C4831A|nr:uncharacterized protein LOZ57_003616 [Ophidiomyces ophidiicola]KAI1946846.1 hypothetical protein LOZ57_003616 [Ophidiomyces ophidiicola]KAI2043831.1 hypothetical protein LOZ43_006525 [Ophidiomyces ophidiicola]KAI2080740.1 hypothetical protein LOZ36_006396 [Ophidiomyces ophidiicola]